MQPIGSDRWVEEEQRPSAKGFTAFVYSRCVLAVVLTTPGTHGSVLGLQNMLLKTSSHILFRQTVQMPPTHGSPEYLIRFICIRWIKRCERVRDNKRSTQQHANDVQVQVGWTEYKNSSVRQSTKIVSVRRKAVLTDFPGASSVRMSVWRSE